MGKYFNLTLYDLIGYLLPGFPTTLSTIMLFDAIAQRPVTLCSNLLDYPAVLVFLVASYFAGHMIQALANLLLHLFHFNGESRVLEGKGKEVLDPVVLKRAARITANHLGCDQNAVTSNALYSICEALLVQKGQLTDRDVYLAREGFYRGLSLSMLISGASTLALSLMVETVSITGTWQVVLGSGLLYLLAGACAVLAVLFYFRFIRFFRRRVESVVLGCIGLQPEGSE